MTDGSRKTLRKDQFDNSWHNPGASRWKIYAWYFVNAVFVKPHYNPFSKVKVILLKMFGAKLGKRCLIKPGVNIKYPWNLEIGDYAGLGENVWIDNLVKVKLGDHVTLSQGAMLLTGNHNYKSVSFDLMVGEITLEDGVWIGARATVCPGVTCKSHSVLAVGSIANHDLEEYSVYSGMPAVKVRDRKLG